MQNESKTCFRGKTYQLYPTKEQKKALDQFFNIYRYIYSWALNMKKQSYRDKLAGLRTRNYTFYDLGKMFAKYRKEPGNEWLLKMPFNTSKLAIKELCSNYQRFFDGYTKHTPGYKSKNDTKQSFRTRHNRFYIDGNQVRFEGLERYSTGPGAKVETIKIGVKLSNHRTDNITYHNPTIHRDNLGRYWVSYVIEEPITPLSTPKTEAIGVDVGIRRTFTLSTGEIFIRPEEKITKLRKRIKRLQKHVARDNKRRARNAKTLGVSYYQYPISKRSEKRSIEVKKLFKHITNLKHDFYHKTIKSIVLRNPEVIGIEKIVVRDLLHRKQRKQLAENIANADFFTMRQYFEDTCEKYNVPLVEAHPEFPSSQRCSVCGNIRKIHSSHTYICYVCGNKMDRDVNAALNLKSLALGRI